MYGIMEISETGRQEIITRSPALITETVGWVPTRLTTTSVARSLMSMAKSRAVFLKRIIHRSATFNCEEIKWAF